MADNIKACTYGKHVGPTWALHDARGIYIGRVCHACEAATRAKYRPEIFTNPSYKADEPIDED